MIVEINIDGHSIYYNVKDEIAMNINEHSIEFSKWLNQIEGSHPFKQYVEFVERDGSVSYAGYTNTFGAEDFMDWLNVDKYNKQVAQKLINLPFTSPDITIHF